MNNVEDNHDSKHKDRIKDIKKYFMSLNIPIISTKILNNTKNRTNEDKDTRGEKGVKESAPMDFRTKRSLCGLT